MKKTLAILLAMTMMVGTLSGCGGGGASSSSSTAGGSSSSSMAENKAVTRGTWNADKTAFTSELLSMTIPLPTGWTVSTDEEIAALMEIGAEQLSDAQKANLDLSKMKNVYEFVITDPTTGTSLMLMAENLKLTPGASGMKEADYATALKTQLDAVPNMDYVIGTPDTYTVGGKTLTRLPATLADGELTQWYLLKKEGDWMTAYICTFATADQANYEAILGAITAK